MNSVLFGKGYWGSIVKEKITGLTNLLLVVDSKTNGWTLSTNLCLADIIFVCSSTMSHYDIVKECIQRDIKYIFCTKPFTGDYEKAKELYDLAKQKDVNIFVDNLFLFRKEIINIQSEYPQNISFIWARKDGCVKENILDSLLYHDLYLLLKWSQSTKWEISYYAVYDNWLSLNMTNGFQECSFEYRISIINRKLITIDGYTIDLSYPKNDPLKECIVSMIEGNIDYDSNKKITLDALKLLGYIKKRLE